MSDQDRDDAPKTLTDEEIVTDKGRDVGRRKAMHLAGGAAAFSAVALATGCGRRRRAVVVTAGNITDQDGGPCADPVNAGRGNSGVTDSDGGQCSDPVGRGRGGAVVQTQQQAYTGITDSDGGQYADPAGYGRGAAQSGVTDSDGGQCADPAGNGRGYSGCTDADGGMCADPGGRGRC